MKFFLLLFCSFFSFSVFPVGPDFSVLTGAIDFSSVIAGVFAGAAAYAVLALAVRGARLILDFIRYGGEYQGESEDLD